MMITVLFTYNSFYDSSYDSIYNSLGIMAAGSHDAFFSHTILHAILITFPFTILVICIQSHLQ